MELYVAHVFVQQVANLHICPYMVCMQNQAKKVTTYGL